MPSARDLVVVAFDASPSSDPGRTSITVDAIVDPARAEGFEVEVVRLVSAGLDRCIEAAMGADAFVFATPVFRASYTTLLKQLFDATPRGMWGEEHAPFQGKPAVVAATGASWHHFLALNDLRNVLGGSFAVHVLPPGVYVPHDGFDEDGTLGAAARDQARAQGEALVAMTGFVRATDVLRSLRPQA